MGKHSGNALLEQNKQMFTNIEINLFVPKDPNQVTANFKILDMIEDNFD